MPQCATMPNQLVSSLFLPLYLSALCIIVGENVKEAITWMLSSTIYCSEILYCYVLTLLVLSFPLLLIYYCVSLSAK